MSLYEYLDFLDTPFKEIKSATNNFADENVLAQGSNFKVYKGEYERRHDWVNIVARKCYEDNALVLNEVSISKNLEHKNIVSVYKISEDEAGHAIIINKHEANGSLEKYLSDPITLTWMQRLHICVRIAYALKYLHFEAHNNHHIIHANIKSSKILLDHNWEPKLHGFGFAVRAKKHRLHLTSKYNGSLQYMDPAYEDTRGLTHKSDIFSFGVVLFEVFFGREASIEDNDNWYFAKLARSHYKEGKLDDLIHPDLRKQMNLQSLNSFATAAYYCLEEKPFERLDTDKLLSELEKALKLQEHPTSAEGTSLSDYLERKSLDHLKFRLKDLKQATDDFSSTKCIGSGAYGKVYKAELNLGEINSPLAIESKKNTKVKSDNKHSTIAIKRIVSKNIEQGKQGFLAEIEMLTKCKHPNVVSLHGFCAEGEETILVYEFVSNGSLAHYFENAHNNLNLTWAQRIQICLDIAHGLMYLHSKTEEKDTIIHRDIKCDNILLDDNWVAKIADFGLSKLRQANQQRSTFITNNIAGTPIYWDPEYVKTGNLKTKSDVYSFGVVMFEIMCGKLAYDKTYGQNGLPSVARQCFNEGTIKNLVDKKMMEADDKMLMLIGPIDQDSLDTFSKVAYDCLAEAQSERPQIDFVIQQLQRALNFQKTNKDNLRMSLEAIKLGTRNFSDNNFIGEGRFFKLYEGQVEHANRCTTIIAKRWDIKSSQGQFQDLLLTEVAVLSSYKHKNIVGLVGYCNEENENIVVYEHASNGRLDKHLGNPCLTWKQRVQICIDIAHGLKFLHEFDVHDEDSLKHRDIKSGSVLLDGDWNAKISNFEMSMKAHVDDDNWHSMGYVDPQYQSCGYLALWSDVYSLGVICIEMLCGRLAWIKGSCVDHSQSLGPLAIRQYKEKGNIDEMIFEGINEQISPQSLTEFLKICTQCLENDPDDRPHLDDVIKQLKKALEFQDNNPQISVKAIKLGTQDFSDCNCVGEGRLWKLYKGEGEHTNGCTAFVVKRWNRESDQGQIQFSTELDILSRYKHENIIGLVGYCKEEKEKIIVYEYASNGTLDKHLGNSSLTWRKRLQIALDIANGLACLHSGNEKREDFMVHRDIKSGNILLDGDWHAKIVNLELSCKSGILKKATHVDENDYDSLGYIDPIYRTKGFLTQKSDIYSLGVILVEMLYGKLTWAKGWENYCQSLGVFATTHYTEKENFQEMIIKAIEEQIAPQEMIFEAIKEQTAPRSLTRFLQIIVRCFDEKEYRLGANEVIKQLEKALKFQDDYEWEMKLPIDYKEIIRASEYPEYYGIIEMKRELYDVFIKGVYLRDHKTLFTLGRNGEGIYEMISAKRFSYRNYRTHTWRSVGESKFRKTALMLDISKLKIRIKITTQFLSLGVNYGAFLIFKFCDTRKVSSKPMYVNLKYKEGGENLHAYFATWRDEEWMMIELRRFLSQKKDTTFEFLLESFSKYYCGRNSLIWIDGIEFRIIDKVKNEEINSHCEIEPLDKQLCLNEDNGRKKHVMLSAAEVLFGSSNVNNVKHFVYRKPSLKSRYKEVIALLPQQVFRISYKIQSQMLSQDTEYACYLIFKLSKYCHGLYCPVKVRDLLHPKSKEAEIIYFRSPSAWNLHANFSAPELREDGWMEVKVWKFNLDHRDCIPINLKLIAYEGTMFALLLSGLEIRPM